uniref:Uncharacterized protein n=1 Tax=Anopheles coluzzii TaxID=1518534 RepID=A0A8W7P2G9_ANOCL
MSGLAAELSGARLWMKVAIATFVCVAGICPNTCSRSKMMYGDQQSTNTITITIVILTVFTLARGMMPRELARLVARSAIPLCVRSQPEKFIGCVMASYRSMLSATSTYVDAYVTQTWTKRIALQAALPARHTTVMRQMMSVSTFSSPTQRSGDIEGGGGGLAYEKVALRFTQRG